MKDGGVEELSDNRCETEENAVLSEEWLRKWQVELFTVIDTFLHRSIIYLCYEAPCGQGL